ncbi:four helix bundle protein [Croceimicrobium sp.]|uniref:four helix bundle protein n=1 Tax=Croceimicrobium sp. TaxID=2828340 RepID=UPI003BAAC464
MHNYRELILWRKSRSLVKKVYQLLPELPEIERFGLRSQIGRSAISIPSNIAEGAGRNSNKEFVKFLSIAQGSSFELATQLYLALDLGYFKKTKLEELFSDLDEIQKINRTLQHKFQTL